MQLDENNWIPAAVFGGSLVVLGVGMMIAHSRAWKRQRQDEELSERDLEHLRNRFSRRTQTSAMVAVVGCMVGLGDVFVWQFGPLIATVYWMLVMLFVFWIALLAIGDFTSVRSHSQITMAEVESKRKALEAELAEYRRRSNGKPFQG